MNEFNKQELRKLYLPPTDSHKGQNGKVLIIGGSKLFHAASLWALDIASRLVDMVYYASVTENNRIVQKAKEQFRNGIVVPRNKIDNYIEEADAVLIGPGLPRPEGKEEDDDDTRELTKRYLLKYPTKRWVIDGGSLQTMETEWIPEAAILTPHVKEFTTLFKLNDSQISNFSATGGSASGRKFQISNKIPKELIQQKAKDHRCIIVLKGQTDIICSPSECITVSGGNAGMTKGGTGDVLAGITTALYAKNDAFLSACAASYFNKRASEKLFETKGYWYNTTELIGMIPHVMKETVL